MVIFGGLALTLMNMLLKPILSLLTLPLNLLTLGLFGWLLNALFVYLLTIVVPQISIANYVFPGFANNGFSLPSVSLSGFQTTILVAFTLSLICNFIFWLFKK